MFVCSSFRFYTSEIVIPLFTGFPADQLYIRIGYFTIKVDGSLFGTDKRRGCTYGQFFTCRNIKFQIGTGIIGRYIGLMVQQSISIVSAVFYDGMTEFHHKVISKVIRYTSVIISCRTFYQPVFRFNRY